MPKWLITAPGSSVDSWDLVLGHELRGPLVLDRELPQEALDAFADREHVSTLGLAAVRV